MPAFEAPVYTLKGIKIRFGSKQLFEDVELYINRGDKISLVGRNGLHLLFGRSKVCNKPLRSIVRSLHQSIVQ